VKEAPKQSKKLPIFLLFLSVARVANFWLSFEAGRKRDFCLYKVGRPIPILVCEQVVNFVRTATLRCLYHS
jgi:hypothetical protein